IYKVGQPVHWLPGLDLIGTIGLPGECAVIPHYDNAEGGTHDTRFCYMGERRLEELEALLPPSGFALGIDEHSAVIVDVGAGRVEVVGRGGRTIRRLGHSRRWPAGTQLTMTALAKAIREAGHDGEGGDGGPRVETAGSSPAQAGASRLDEPPPGSASRPSPLIEQVARLERRVEAALAGRRAGHAGAGVLRARPAGLDWAARTPPTA